MAGNKKNIVPLVLAVILAMAAVFAVNRLIGEKTSEETEEKVAVLVASRNLKAEEMINEGSFNRKLIPRSAAPTNAIMWSRKDMILNQKMKNTVEKGNYILFTDIGVGHGLSDMIADGEWAVSITFDGGAITSRLRPGDEIAIVGTMSVVEKKKSLVSNQKDEENDRKITTVLLPRVRILALEQSRDQGGDEFVLALSPKYAQMLIAAQENGISLTPMLRKPHDETNLNRITTGLVDKETFFNMVQGVEKVTIPEIPSKQ